jgi:hypothetical protein
MNNRKIIFPLLGLIGICVFKFIIDPLWTESITNEFLNKSYIYTVTVKPNENEGNRGTYKYQCIDLDSNSHWYNQTFSPEISSTELYNSVVVGDTIEKKKGNPLILLKKEHLILKIPVNYDFSKVVDTVLVR